MTQTELAAHPLRSRPDAHSSHLGTSLTRKHNLWRAGGSSRRRFVPSAGSCGWSGDCGVLAGPGWLGDAGEGDFVAEAGELAGVVAGLAGGAALVVVVVRAEVVVAHAGVG